MQGKLKRGAAKEAFVQKSTKRSASDSSPRRWQEFVWSSIIRNVFLAIQAKAPNGHSRHIETQQDNAKPHSCWNDSVAQKESRYGAWNIKIVNQPANSRDEFDNEL